MYVGVSIEYYEPSLLHYATMSVAAPAHYAKVRQRDEVDDSDDELGDDQQAEERVLLVDNTEFYVAIQRRTCERTLLLCALTSLIGVLIYLALTALLARSQYIFDHPSPLFSLPPSVNDTLFSSSTGGGGGGA